VCPSPGYKHVGNSSHHCIRLHAKRPSSQQESCPVLGVTCLRKLQVIQSKCLRIATGAPWYMSNVQIHEDLGVPFFSEHIRALTESYDSKLAGVGNPLVQQLGRYLR
jgi:hypothetical protein